MRSENLYWVWLSEKLGVASPDLPRLMTEYRSPYDIYAASPEELAEIHNLTPEAAHRLSDKSLESAANIVDFCAKTGVRILPYNDNEFPRLLRMLQDPPALLYVKGTLPDMNSRVCIAVVGTRRMSKYGRDNAFRFAYDLGAASVVVVSGLALGIDGVAAGGAISGGGKTVAVLGCGIDRMYPVQHTRLAGLVVENGAIVTEFAPGTPPVGSNFPIRNRIISGMCQGTLVVEADEHSGALITAKRADMQGRQVFAIPGNLGEQNSEGPNVLIRDGGLIAVEPDDILAEYKDYYDKFIDIPRMMAARRQYDFSEEILDRMGICARVPKDRQPHTNNAPSAPREAFVRTGRRGTNPSADAGIQFNDNIDDRLSSADYVLQASGSRAAAQISFHDIGAGQNKPVTTVCRAERRISDKSAEALASLDERHRALFAEMPDDRAINTDALSRLGFTVGEVMSIMTKLEIMGLVSSLPGGLYIKR